MKMAFANTQPSIESQKTSASMCYKLMTIMMAMTGNVTSLFELSIVTFDKEFKY